jgi:repressor LexA
MMNLTPNEARLLRYLQERTEPVAPSFDEMRDFLGIKSKGQVSRIIDGLEGKGRLRKVPYKPRAIVLIDDARCPTCGQCLPEVK